jgi:hypothetical protein
MRLHLACFAILPFLNIYWLNSGHVEPFSAILLDVDKIYVGMTGTYDRSNDVDGARLLTFRVYSMIT